MRLCDQLLARTLAAGVLVCLFAGGAHAVPIASGSELSINGPDNFNDGQVTFEGAGNVQGTAGSFTTLPDCALCVNFSQNLTPTTTGQLWSISDAGNTSTFNIFSVGSFTPGVSGGLPNLTVFATGTLTLTGFDPTVGQMELTTQGPHDTRVTFSATAVPIPTVVEPASIAMLGSGLLGMMAWRQRRRR